MRLANSSPCLMLALVPCLVPYLVLGGCGADPTTGADPASYDGGPGTGVDGSPTDGAAASDSSSGTGEDAAVQAPGCPATAPTMGTACSLAVGSWTCGYDGGKPNSGTVIVYACTNGVWSEGHVHAGTFVPGPAFTCPVNQPLSTDACSVTDLPPNPAYGAERSSSCFFHVDPSSSLTTCYCNSEQGAGTWTWGCSVISW